MNSNGKPLSLADWPVAVLAGGLARRMRPFTETIPKALIEVAGEPFVMHQLRLLKRAGFQRIVFCLGYLGEQIVQALGTGDSLGLEISHVFDGPVLRGTGGALKNATPQIGDSFLILYGDSYLPIDYSSVVGAFLHRRQPALMTIYKNEGRWDTSNVAVEADRVRCYDKHAPNPEMLYIDYGLSVVSASIFEPFADQETFDLGELYTRLAANGQLAAFEVRQRFYEIGSPKGLRDLDCHLRQAALTVRS